MDLAELATPYVIARRHVAGRTAVLRADLHHAVVFARRFDHSAAFPDIVRWRLLDIDVLTGLAGTDRSRRVPVIGSGDDNGVDGLVVEDAAHLFDGLGRLPLPTSDGLGGPGQAFFVQVANTGDLGIL